MKTADRISLQTILQHKEYFDDRLILIAKNAESKIENLENENYILKKQNRNLTQQLSSVKLREQNNDKRIRKLEEYIRCTHGPMSRKWTK